jgi:hypothetical protein
VNKQAALLDAGLLRRTKSHPIAARMLQGNVWDELLSR